ncbi:MAG: restriction endonuclease, partial [Candidatus Nanopelagicales bacterium]
MSWDRTEPGDVEHLIAMLVYSEHRYAIRVRPSVGDGGIDILVPIDGDPTKVVVYQVKSFHDNLTARQKKDIKKSHRALCEYAAAKGLTIVAWRLILPLDPTNENREWLATTIASAGDFPCEWHGLIAVDAMAAKFPKVVDYYVGNGRERLEEAVRGLTELLGITGGRPLDEGGPLSTSIRAGDIHEIVKTVHETINQHDPHYRYDYSVDRDRPTVLETPLLVAAVQRQVGEAWVTVKVSALTVEAPNERPIPINVTVSAKPGSPDAALVEEFLKYGSQLSLPLGSATFSADLPGGLGTEAPLTCGITMSPRGSLVEPFDRKLAILDEDGDVVVEVHVVMDAVTTGLQRTGARATGRDILRCFTCEMRTDLTTKQMHISFTMSPIFGRRPSEVIDALRFMNALHPPNTLRVRAAYGPSDVDESVIPEAASPPPDLLELQALAECLDAIQNHTDTQIRIPGDVTAEA